MSDEIPVEKGNAEGIGVERVGETIHRERLTRNILLETISQDLKLNVEFIKGIEESNYTNLPSMPYIRVYIKSIAEYLRLNADELLERFSQEQNLSVPDPQEERRDTISIKVQGSKSPNPFMPILIIAAIIIVVALLLRKPSSDESVEPVPAEDSVSVEIPVDTGEISDDSIPKGVSEIVDSGVAEIDSASLDTGSADTAVQSNTGAVNGANALAVADSVDSTPAVSEPVAEKLMKFSITGKEATSWVQVFVDGKSEFKGNLKARNTLEFEAKDSINYVVGKNSSVRYKRNNKQLWVEGAGLKVIKVTPETVENWSHRKWKRVFAGRL